MSDDLILCHDDSNIRTLTINRADKKNALTPDMYTTLTEKIVEAQSLASVRVVFIKGAGGAFTSGNDLMDFMNTPPAGPDSPVLKFLAALVDTTKPLVAQVQGAAIGIGTTMLLHCDLVYADVTAKFKMPFVPLGLSPEGASTFLLPRAMGFRQASELLMFGGSFDAETAQARGLINEVFSAAELDASVQKRLVKLAAQAPASLRATKELLRGPYRVHLHKVLLDEGAIFVERLKSDEAAEAFGAFFEKRAPDFSKFD